MIDRPIGAYSNWGAYDELSDRVELTEALALRQLDELLRLRQLGVRLDYYVMDAFWYARDGAYRTWRQPHWPRGPDRWLDRCREHGVKPGLWVATNGAWCQLDPAPAWEDSLTKTRRSMCLFHGGFLADFLDVLHLWYERGVRLFKFDFANLRAATPALMRKMLPSEIRSANEQALIAGLRSFRAAHSEVVLMAYNGFDEEEAMDNTSRPFRRTVSARWLEVFDSLYCGDARPADVPAMEFWRSKDVYSDHMMRVYELNGIPLSRIDNAAFMVGTTGTCYGRGTAAWKGMLLLSLARGGWVNKYYGNLDLLDEAKGRWFAQAQQMFWPLLAGNRTRTFGALPGTGEPYGLSLLDAGNGLIVAVNPAQGVRRVQVPGTGPRRLLFRDAGFDPVIEGDFVVLGPEQLALLGVGTYADARYDLGVQEDVVIPRAIRRLDVAFVADGERALVTQVAPAAGQRLRVIFRQQDKDGLAVRTSGGAPPDGKTLGQLLRIRAVQDGHELPVRINYDKAIWSGLSWAVGEVDCGGGPIAVRCTTEEPRPVVLKGEIHVVQ